MTPPRLQLQEPGSTAAPYRGPLLLAHGFRPFFLLAGLSGALIVAAWVLIYLDRWPFPGRLEPFLWHAHEMVFGFGVAALCGFLLTAVPSWTGSPPLRGGPLLLLVLLWGLGRVAVLEPAVLGFPGLAAAADLALVPALAVVIGRRIVAIRQVRNYPFPILLVVLFAANLVFHLDGLGVAGVSARVGVHLGVAVLVVLVTIVSGRITPNFTANALRLRGETPTAAIVPRVEMAVVAAVVVALVADLALGPGPVAGAAAAAAAGMLALRMRTWETAKILGQPILWVLHLGHGWLVAGFALAAASGFLAWVPATAALHALTAGAVGTVVIGVITRAALGHTGRPLTVGPAIVVAYGLVSVAAVLRVAAPMVLGEHAVAGIAASGILWSAAFAIYGVVYWPILTRPRIDGRDG